MEFASPLLLPPFRRNDAPRLNLDDADVRRLLYQGDIVRLAHGLYAGRYRVDLATDSADREALRAMAMIERYKPAVAARRTAAAIHDLWIIGATGPVNLYRLNGARRESYEVQVEPLALPKSHLTAARGVPLTTIPRTVIDLLAGTPDIELQAVIDSALRLGSSKAELRELVAELGVRRNGVSELIDYADARSESALESISRWRFRVRGLPTPELQVTFDDESGPFARVDFFWAAQRVVGEADGALKYDEAGVAKRAEEVRQERLEALGLTVVRWTFDEVMLWPDALLARVREALAGKQPIQRT